MDAPLNHGPKKSMRLVSLRDEHARLAEAKDMAEQRAESLQERLALVQLDASSSRREKSSLQSALDALTKQLQQQAEGKVETEDDERLRNEIDILRERLLHEEEASAKKINESRQFQQLRALLREKSEQVVNLRRRLAKYEPDDAKDCEE
jgi:chromosome segregation ATPase